MKTVEMLKLRIALLESRKTDNQRIVAKLKRELRRMENSYVSY